MAISSATIKDKKAITEYLKHYGTRIAEKRAECYIAYNHTILAKDEGKVVGCCNG